MDVWSRFANWDQFREKNVDKSWQYFNLLRAFLIFHSELTLGLPIFGTLTLINREIFFKNFFGLIFHRYFQKFAQKWNFTEISRFSNISQIFLAKNEQSLMMTPRTPLSKQQKTLHMYDENLYLSKYAAERGVCELFPHE